MPRSSCGAATPGRISSGAISAGPIIARPTTAMERIPRLSASLDPGEILPRQRRYLPDRLCAGAALRVREHARPADLFLGCAGREAGHVGGCRNVLLSARSLHHAWRALERQADQWRLTIIAVLYALASILHM